MGWREWLDTEGPFKIFLIIWLIANLAVFLVNWYKYQGDPYAYLRDIVGTGLQWARGGANILNLNCALILFPVCRNLVNFLRGCFEGKRSIRRIFDKSITFHKYCAWMICVGTVIHVIAHIFNVKNLVNANGKYPRVPADQSWEDVLWTSWPGLTGVIVTVALILMVTTATDMIRKYYFELFWYTHHLFIVFYIALGIHGYSGFVEKQTNYAQHPFGCSPRESTTGCTLLGPSECASDTLMAAEDASLHCCPCMNSVIITKPGGAGTWWWIVGPCVIYVLERLYRLWKSETRKLRILRVVKHHDRSPVLEINLQKVPTKAGQYVFLNVPEVSQLEWHPFTLTSCPELDTINLHVRVAGDWTAKLAERVGMNVISFRFRDKKVPTSKEALDFLRQIYPERTVTYAFVLSDGLIQYPSDEDFTPKDVQTLQGRVEVDKDTVTTKDGLAPHLLPTCAIDGPFGTCSEDIYHFDAAVLIGAGIGVTPYASILQSLYFQLAKDNLKHTHKLKKVYFYWMCSGFDAWGWFASLLMKLEDALNKTFPDFLVIRIFTSSGWKEEDVGKLILADLESTDNGLIFDEESGLSLHSKMNYGRPNWTKEFETVARNHPNQNVGVFFCGPKPVSHALHKNCIKYTEDYSKQGTKFFYHKENF